jgi:hypothetical protein
MATDPDVDVQFIERRGLVRASDASKRAMKDIASSVFRLR